MHVIAYKTKKKEKNKNTPLRVYQTIAKQTNQKKYALNVWVNEHVDVRCKCLSNQKIRVKVIKHFLWNIGGRCKKYARANICMHDIYHVFYTFFCYEFLKNVSFFMLFYKENAHISIYVYIYIYQTLMNEHFLPSVYICIPRKSLKSYLYACTW